jgi:hypothetical protein
MLQEGIKNLYLERLFQRDGIALTEIAGDETSVRVPSHGTVQTEDHLYKYHLYCIKPQKHAGLQLTTDEVRANNLQHNNLMNIINVLP